MKVREGSLSQVLLKALENTIEAGIFLDDFIDNSYKYLTGPDLSPRTKKSRLWLAVHRLRMRGLLDESITEGKIIIKLSTLGRDYLGTSVEWDGKYRIVFWDIPEKNRRVRDLFRRRLKEWGFKNWQRSVWVSKRNVTNELKSLVEELGMEKWVAIIESDDPSLSRL